MRKDETSLELWSIRKLIVDMFPLLCLIQSLRIITKSFLMLLRLLCSLDHSLLLSNLRSKLLHRLKWIHKSLLLPKYKNNPSFLRWKQLTSIEKVLDLVQEDMGMTSSLIPFEILSLKLKSDLALKMPEENLNLMSTPKLQLFPRNNMLKTCLIFT